MRLRALFKKRNTSREHRHCYATITHNSHNRSKHYTTRQAQKRFSKNMTRYHRLHTDSAVHTHKVMLPLEVLSGCLTSGRSVGDFGQSLVSLTDGRTPLYADGRCLAGSRQLLQHRRWSTHWRSASGRWLWWYLPHRQVTKHPIWPAGIVTRTQEVTGSHHNLTWRQIKYSQTSISG